MEVDRVLGLGQSDNYVDIPFGALCATAVANTLGGVANVAILQRFRVARAITVAKIGIYNGATAAGNHDAGIYTSDGTTWTRIASGGGVAVGSTSTLQEIALSAAVTLNPYVDYWLAYAFDDATHTVNRVNAATTNWSGHGNRVISKTTSYPLPATITSPSKSGYVILAQLIV